MTILGADQTNGVRLRAGTAGSLHGFVITGPAGYSNCLRVNGDESQALATAGDLSIADSIVACEAGSNFGDQFAEDWFLADASNMVSTADQLGLADNGYMPATGSVLLDSSLAFTGNDLLEDTDFIGAMDASNDWTQGWVTVGLD